jgi:CcmD family protein
VRRIAPIDAKQAHDDRKTNPRFLMEAWGFVFLAYGVVWGAILIYRLALKRRLRRAETELAQLRASQESQKNAQT